MNTNTHHEGSRTNASWHSWRQPHRWARMGVMEQEQEQWGASGGKGERGDMGERSAGMNESQWG